LLWIAVKFVILPGDDPKAKQEADEMLNLIAESSQDLAKEKAKGFSCW